MTSPTAPSSIITNLKAHFLVAGPQLAGSFFDKSVIYICTHTADGAMGMVINNPIKEVTFGDIAESMGIKSTIDYAGHQPIIFSGGPVDPNRGFVLHSAEYQLKDSQRIGLYTRLSATADIVGDIAKGNGPKNVNFCLGYSGWGPGQLEKEILQNSWFVLPEDKDILFEAPCEKRYQLCTHKLGITASNYVEVAGRA